MKILSILIVMAMVMSLCLIFVSAEGIQEVIDNTEDSVMVIITDGEFELNKYGLIFDVNSGRFYLDVEVDGVAHSANEYTGQPEAWSWNEATKTLTLTNFEWKTSAYNALTFTWEHENEQEITINLNGNNTFLTGNDTGFSNIISYWWDLIITGSGTLNVIMSYVSNVEDESFNFSINRRAASRTFIFGCRSLTINSGTVNLVVGENAIANVGLSTNTLIMNGGTLNTTGNLGIQCNELTINSGTINVVGGEVGILSEVIINNGVIKTTGSIIGLWGGAIINNGKLNAVGDDVGINASEVEMNSGILIAQGYNSAISQPLDGILSISVEKYTYWTNTEASDPGGVGITYPAGAAFVNSEEYRFIRIEVIENEEEPPPNGNNNIRPPVGNNRPRPPVIVRPTPIQPPPPERVPSRAEPTAAPVLIDGENVAFQAYHISGHNFFRLRDVAYALNGTAAQFNVVWDGENNVIILTIGENYEVVGGEMTNNSSGALTANPTNSAIILNGAAVDITAFHINGNNFFMLRDLGAALGFEVEWDEDAGAILINTN